MAESIALHLSAGGLGTVETELNTVAKPAIGTGTLTSWVFPREGDGDVVVYFCEEVLAELQSEQREQVLEILGNGPIVTLCIELSRSRGELSLQAAQQLAVVLLNRFRGVANDLLGTVWTLGEIEEGKDRRRFLDVYRR